MFMICLALLASSPVVMGMKGLARTTCTRVLSAWCLVWPEVSVGNAIVTPSGNPGIIGRVTISVLFWFGRNMLSVAQGWKTKGHQVISLITRPVEQINWKKNYRPGACNHKKILIVPGTECRTVF